METERNTLKAMKEDLKQHCGKQAQELAEARQVAKQRLDRDSREIDSLRAKVEALNTEVERLGQQEGKVGK